jgi:hypothetical protein
MGRPVSGYYLKSGERVPSVTEILGKFKDPAPLIGWSFKRGYESGMAASKGLPAPRSAYAEAEQAAAAGQIAHDLLECHVIGKPYVYDGKRPAPGVMERAEQGFANGKKWLEGSALKVVDTEKTLVREQYRFGGTRDALMIDPARRHHLSDYKTSNAIYADYLIQVAAYGLLAEECEGIVIDGGYDILRFSKEHADFCHKWFADLTEAREIFIEMARIYPKVMRLEDRVS